MSCARTNKRLSLYVGGDLELRERAEVEAHMQRCLSCYREYQSYRSMLESVRGWSRDLPTLREAGRGGSLVEEVLARIDGPPPVARWGPRLVTISGWAAALVLGGLLAWYTSERRSVPGAARSAPPTTMLVHQPSEAWTDRSAGEVPVPEPLKPVPGEGVRDLTLEERIDRAARRNGEREVTAVPVHYRVRDY